jgi:hypothetical protein
MGIVMVVVVFGCRIGMAGSGRDGRRARLGSVTGGGCSTGVSAVYRGSPKPSADSSSSLIEAFEESDRGLVGSRTVPSWNGPPKGPSALVQRERAPRVTKVLSAGKSRCAWASRSRYVYCWFCRPASSGSCGELRSCGGSRVSAGLGEPGGRGKRNRNCCHHLRKPAARRKTSGREDKQREKRTKQRRDAFT